MTSRALIDGNLTARSNLAREEQHLKKRRYCSIIDITRYKINRLSYLSALVIVPSGLTELGLAYILPSLPTSHVILNEVA